MSNPAGFLVWVQGTRGPEPQRWSEQPRAIGSDYWSEKAGRVLLPAIPLSEEEFTRPIEVIAAMYPALVREAGA